MKWLVLILLCLGTLAEVIVTNKPRPTHTTGSQVMFACLWLIAAVWLVGWSGLF